MFSPLSTKYPTAGELISNRIASSLSDIPYPFTARYHKLFSSIYVTYFFTSVSPYSFFNISFNPSPPFPFPIEGMGVKPTHFTHLNIHASFGTNRNSA